MTFVHGSNLYAAFKHLDLYVDDYESMYQYLFEQVVTRWRTMITSATPPPAQHVRVYWYVVDAMDEWDIQSPRTRQYLLERFLDDREVKARWFAEAHRQPMARTSDPAAMEQQAFALFSEDLKTWYERRQNILSGMDRFHHAVESSSDFIEVIRCGRWKIDLLRKTITEKGLDVYSAVDMIGMRENYDVAILVGGDSEGVPSLEYLKSWGKQVAVIELLRGFPPEARGKGYASPLKQIADFVVPIYESELVRLQLAEKGDSDNLAYREAA